jgi:hypothetical protein
VILLAGLLCLGARSSLADVLIGGAASRGFFGWEAIGGYERKLPTRPIGNLPLDFPLRAEGHFSTRDNVTNIVVSSYLFAHLTVPGFHDVDFGPYLATGVGGHIQGSWSDLREFGGVETESEAVVKWHALVGATLARRERVDLYVEGRYTEPSSFKFDYILFGLRIHPAPDGAQD